MRFSKYHGTANDFVLVEDLEDEMRLAPALIQALCDRRRGVGADGVIRIVAADDADFTMDYYNADGRRAEMCGNGIRCLGKYVYDRGLIASTEFLVATRAGPKRLVVQGDHGIATQVTVDMGAPALERGEIPMTGDPSDTFVGQRLEVDGRSFTATAVSMGNPHCVLLLDADDDLTSVEVSRLGPMVETLATFPERTNVEFVKVSEHGVAARVWERGSGETLACGTGACAVLVASALAGVTDRRSEVEFPGGRLSLEWADAGTVLLTGPAKWVFDGELDQSWLAEATAAPAS